MFQNLHSLIEAKLAERIKQGLVRVLDIVEDRRVYGVSVTRIDPQ